jgi:hypothetical protein
MVIIVYYIDVDRLMPFRLDYGEETVYYVVYSCCVDYGSQLELLLVFSPIVDMSRWLYSQFYFLLSTITCIIIVVTLLLTKVFLLLAVMGYGIMYTIIVAVGWAENPPLYCGR